MQKLSFRKFSILGLVLMAASAVTAAMLPSNSNKDTKQALNGSLTNDNGATSRVTCTVSDGVAANVASECNASTGGATSTSASGFLGSNDTASGGAGQNTTVGG